MTGSMPRWSVEHINGDRTDNRWENLREGQRPQKAIYRAPWREPTSTPGVWQVGERFEAMVDVGGVTFNLGAFETHEAAADAIARIHKQARQRLAEHRKVA
jgi:hypothetical protein